VWKVQRRAQEQLDYLFASVLGFEDPVIANVYFRRVLQAFGNEALSSVTEGDAALKRGMKAHPGRVLEYVEGLCGFCMNPLLHMCGILSNVYGNVAPRIHKRDPRGTADFQQEELLPEVAISSRMEMCLLRKASELPCVTRR